MSLGNLCKIPTTIVSSVKLFYINCKCDTVVFLTRKILKYIYIYFFEQLENLALATSTIFTRLFTWFGLRNIQWEFNLFKSNS